MKDFIAVLVLLIPPISSYLWLLPADIYFDWLNPMRNYKVWTNLNLFGVIIVTLLLNILCLPFALIYWCYIFIRFIFTR